MQKIIRRRGDYDDAYLGSFKFDSETWHKIGSTGTGPVGHHSQQGHRNLYASPRKAKDGRHRFVLCGTGYWPSAAGGLGWGEDAVEVSYDTAAHIMDAEHLPKYAEEPEELA